MMKKTICLLFVLALVAQICAIPTEIDAEKIAKAANDHAAAAANEAKKEATELAEKATNPGHAKGKAGSHNEGPLNEGNERHPNEGNAGHHNEGNSGHHNEGNAGHHNEGNAGHHTKGAKHGGEGAGMGPASKLIKRSEEFTKELADKGAKLVTDILGLWKI